MKTINQKISGFADRVTPVCRSKRGELFVDTGIKILIAVVLGGLLLSLMYGVIQNTVMPVTQSKIGDMFNLGSASAAEELPTYSFTYYDANVYDDMTAYFQVDEPFENFDHLEIDGVTVNPSYYQNCGGAAISNIELSESYVSQLSSGEHTIRLFFTDGFAQAVFEK